MTVIHYALTRRTFLKLVTQLSIMMAGIHPRKALAAAEQQHITEQPGYGAGNYSTGDYPGYTTYLPFISKEMQ